MTIKEVSAQFDITQDTLRYYEKIGMIPPVTRNASGIRDYTDGDLRWVQLAKCMRASGLSVEAMVQYVQLYQQGNETILARLELLQSQKAELLERRAKIDDA
ncbi:MAG: MerR family transcriptional regulator, partial [Clostridia bacterium]|nr:MerR family transcriptional regulator [Clostridia bacterium]